MPNCLAELLQAREGVQEHPAHPDQRLRFHRGSDDAADSVTTVRISQPYGRFSNNLRQLCHAVQVARHLGATVIELAAQPTWEDLLVAEPRHGSLDGLQVRLSTTPATAGTLEGTFYYPEVFRWLDLTSPSRRSLLLQWNPLLDLPHPPRALPPSTLVIHLRSGDLFRDAGTHPAYGQPPLAYYQAVIIREAPQEVVMVYEDSGNPVIDALDTHIRALGLPLRISSGTLWQDLEPLLAASVLVGGMGTFIPAVVGLSRQLQRLYQFGHLAWLHDYGVLPPELVLVRDKGSYSQQMLRRNWRNLPEQRRLMLEYPLSQLDLPATGGWHQS